VSERQRANASEARKTRGSTRVAPAQAETPAKPRGDELREALLRAAITLINQSGVETLSLRETARLAGVSHQAPYSHFADRAALLAAVAEQGFRRLHDKMSRAVAAAGDDAAAALEALGFAYVEFAVENPAHFRVLYAAELAERERYPELQAQSDTVYNLLISVIVDLQRRAGDKSDPAEYALTAWSTVHGLASLLINNQVRKIGKKKPRQLMEIINRVLRSGLPH
jgi:AcrR family transcriptional regulator